MCTLGPPLSTTQSSPPRKTPLQRVSTKNRDGVANSSPTGQVFVIYPCPAPRALLGGAFHSQTSFVGFIPHGAEIGEHGILAFSYAVFFSLFGLPRFTLPPFARNVSSSLRFPEPRFRDKLTIPGSLPTRPGSRIWKLEATKKCRWGGPWTCCC